MTTLPIKENEPPKSEYIISDIDICGGKPVLKGTRIPVSQLIMELSEDSITYVADQFDISAKDLTGMIEEVAKSYDYRVLPPSGRKMSFQEARDYTLKKFHNVFKKLAEND
jgi:uncharacterized protein (DUF433 family)